MTDEQEALKNMAHAIGGGLSKERKKEMYFGKPPKGAYFGPKKDLAHIHDLTMSEETKKRLYGIGGGKENSVGEVVEARLGNDSKSDLVRELADQTALTRKQAEEIVERWMLRNNLVEVDDKVLGKIIVPKDRGI